MINPVQQMQLDGTALLRPFSSTKCSSVLLKLPFSCSVCSSADCGKYKCPQCSARTCSVLCFKEHKDAKKCVVQTDQQWTKIQKYSQFTDNISITDQLFMHNIKETMKVNKTADFVSKDPNKQPSKVSLSNDQRFLLQNAQLRRIWLHLDDASSSKGSRYERFSDTIFWACTVKFVSRSSPTGHNVSPSAEGIADCTYAESASASPALSSLPNKPIVDDYNGSDGEDIEGDGVQNCDRMGTEHHKMETDQHNDSMGAESGLSDGSSGSSQSVEEDEQQMPLEWMRFTVENIPENIRVVTLLRQFLRPKSHGPVISLSQIDMEKMGPFASASNSLLSSASASSSSDQENADKLMVYLEVSLNSDAIGDKLSGEQTKEDDFVRYYVVDPNRTILDNLRNRHVNGQPNFVVVLRRGTECGELELPLMSEEEQKQLQQMGKDGGRAMDERPKWQRKNFGGGMRKGNFNWRGRRAMRGNGHQQQQRHSADGGNVCWAPNQRQDRPFPSAAAQFQPTNFTPFHPYQRPVVNYNLQWRGQSSQQRGGWNALGAFYNSAANNCNRGGFL